MGLSGKQFTREFKLAAVRRLEAGGIAGRGRASDIGPAAAIRLKHSHRFIVCSRRPSFIAQPRVLDHARTPMAMSKINSPATIQRRSCARVSFHSPIK
jgi:hypothetical protein